MRKTCETRDTREKRWPARDNAKIDYTRFTIRLFSDTIKFYPLSHEKTPLSHAKLLFPLRDVLRCETKEICHMKQHKQHEITHTHVLHLARFSHLTDFPRIACSWLNTVTSAHSNQCPYFAIASKECYAPRLQTLITCVNGQACYNFRGMVQCYGQMLRSNFLYLVTSLRTALVTWRSSRRCYITCLYPA